MDLDINKIFEDYIDKYIPNVQLLDEYLALYKNVQNNNVKIILTHFHQEINQHFEFLYKKFNNNKHYNADSSRELKLLIDNFQTLQKNCQKNNISIILTKDYNDLIKHCKGFLKESNGSIIPDEIIVIEIEKDNQIFEIDDQLNTIIHNPVISKAVRLDIIQALNKELKEGFFVEPEYIGRLSPGEFLNHLKENY